MPNYSRIVEQSIAAAPQFFADVPEVFGFLEAEYGYRLHAERVENIDWVPDTCAEVVYLNRKRHPAKIAVKVSWTFHTAAIDVVFLELQRPGVFNEASDVMGSVFLRTLAEVLGQQDDPAFLLGDADQVDGRTINERVKIVQANLRGVLEGLAIATERYAAAILRGDTTILPEVKRYYADKRQSFKI